MRGASEVMMNVGERLREARINKGLKQSDVAAVLSCAPTSLTNWETNKIEPSFGVLEGLCNVLGVHPLDLLDKTYSYTDIVDILGKPAHEREYQETVALNFSRSILERLLPDESQRLDAQRNEETVRFLRDNRMLDRFGGALSGAEIETLMNAYSDKNIEDNNIDADLLFAFHALTNHHKWAVIAILQGLISQETNIQPLVANMDKALRYTKERMAFYAGVIDYVIPPDMPN
jgi:transcriptional regulator with XRE-family HTH domain